MREYLPTLVGNAALRARLGADLARGAFAHAYILEGPEGSGKHTLAREIAMSLACEHRADARYPLPCRTCPTCRKIAEGNSPDVIKVTREEDRMTMGVDVVRALRNDVSVVPNDLDFKIYIVEDAHTMTEQAQNALLLTLEEPPAFVVFLLLCNEAGLMLETIRSRAPILRMQAVSEEEISAHLLSHPRAEIVRAAKALQEGNSEEYAALLRMANGRVGRALMLLEEEPRSAVLERREAVLSLCTALANGKRAAELTVLLRSFGTTREELVAKLLLFSEALRDLTVLSCAEAAPLLFFTDREGALDMSARFTARELLELAAATEDTLRSLAANANTRLAMTQYLCRILA